MKLNRWSVASKTKDNPLPFTKDAIDVLFNSSKGIPRSICQIADVALLAAFNQDIKAINSDLTKVERILTLLQSTDLKPNTFRYTPEELNFIRDVSYEAQVKYNTKLDKNDVARIGLDWLMEAGKQTRRKAYLQEYLQTSKKGSNHNRK